MRKQIQHILTELQTALKKIPEIVYLGHPALRKRAVSVTIRQGKHIAVKLQRVLLKYRNIIGVGRGIAAPQIGESKSVFVTYVGDQFQVYVNPRIVRQSKSKNYFRESCLSARELWCDVKRPESVTLKWSDESGRKQMKTFVGFEARLILHEYDHLLGVICVDRAEKGSIAYCTEDVTKERLRKSASDVLR